jgi:DNA invertase Pin-like site-specific DNA recombinase
MGGRGSGRTPPAYLEDGRVVTLRNALATGNTRTAAAAYAGIHRDTLYAWLARRPMSAQAVEKAEADAEVRAVATVLKAAQ